MIELIQTAPHATAGEMPSSPARLTVLIASVGTFLVLVAFTSTVTTVGPTAQALHAGTSGRTWILSSISLGLAVALLALGELADSRGRRRFCVWSTWALALTSVAGGFAPSIEPRGDDLPEPEIRRQRRKSSG